MTCDYSEQGMLSPTERMRQVCQRAITYVLARQSPSGGFCFYRTTYVDEPNLADTWHAVVTLSHLGQDIPHIEALHDFVVSVIRDSYQPATLYFGVETLQLLDASFHADHKLRDRIASLSISAAPMQAGGQVRGWLERTRLIVRLKRRVETLAESDAIADRVMGLQRDGGFGARANLWDTWLGLDILAQCDVSQPPFGAEAFVDSLQDPAQGFTATRQGRMTSLEVIAAGVQSCILLGLPIRYRGSALAYVFACQTAKGGFARTPDALADLEQTHSAVVSMRSLCRGEGVGLGWPASDGKPTSLRDRCDGPRS